MTRQERLLVRFLYLVPVALVLASVMLLTGCTWAQRKWYLCDRDGFKGWDYERECLRITGASR